MIKVSVIVAVYNAEQYLGACLDSLLAQTLADIEIIAVDDGSTDSSGCILAQYAARTGKLKCYAQQNSGAAAARNLALRYATGEYIGFVDSDDFVDPDMYETLYGRAAAESVDIVECNLRHTWRGGEDIEIMQQYCDPSDLLCFGRYVVWNKIFRRDWLRESGVQFPEGCIYEDVAFVANLIPYIRRYAYADIAPIHYVQRLSSANNSASAKTMEIIPVLQYISAFYQERGFAETFSAELEYLYTRILLCSSLARICRIRASELRRMALRANWELLAQTWPKWRSGKVLRKQTSRRAIYMKTVNAFTYRVYAALLTAAYASGVTLRRRRMV